MFFSLFQIDPARPFRGLLPAEEESSSRIPSKNGSFDVDIYIFLSPVVVFYIWFFSCLFPGL